MLGAVDEPTNWWWRDEEPVEPAACAIFDMDGVISDANGRQHLLAHPGRDWDRFFAAAGSDVLYGDNVALLELLAQTLQIVLVTARPMRIRPDTVAWLSTNDVDYDLLVMRPDGDRGPSSTFKRSALAALRAFGFDPRIAFEDDVRNVEMFRSEGISCVYVHSGYYD